MHHFSSNPNRHYILDASNDSFKVSYNIKLINFGHKLILNWHNCYRCRFVVWSSSLLWSFHSMFAAVSDFCFLLCLFGCYVHVSWICEHSFWLVCLRFTFVCVKSITWFWPICSRLMHSFVWIRMKKKTNKTKQTTNNNHANEND